MVQRDELLPYLEELLNVSAFDDYCPNGLQVEGRTEINTIVGGVTASQALVDVAVEKGADALLVHHGYFWKGEDPRLVGIKYRRLKSSTSSITSMRRPSLDESTMCNNTTVPGWDRLLSTCSTQT